MLKKAFDIVFSLLALGFFSIVIIIFWLIAAIDTRSNGFFLQKRIGQFGKPFNIIKLRSIRQKGNRDTISKFGSFIRRTKIDELPQLINILLGHMSIVGPRPDVPGYYDLLQGEERKIMELKPGLTSLASIKYINEEMILARQENPLKYNDEVIFPDKVKMNLDYYYNNSIFVDIKIIIKTIFRY